MGRSPFFAQYVRQTPDLTNTSLGSQFLHDHFDEWVASDSLIETMPFYSHDYGGLIKSSTSLTLPSNLYIQINSSTLAGYDEHVSIPRVCVERSCSLYNGREDYFPNAHTLYHICSAEVYEFEDDNGQKWIDKILNVRSTGEENHTITWMLRIDGMVLNVESFQPRGVVTDFDIIEV